MGIDEIPLPPPRDLLRWLVKHAKRPAQSSALGKSKSTREKREKLLAKDPQVIDEALTSLREKEVPGSAWYILEGPSWPDVFLIANGLMLVVEGKRTEAKPTRSTTWMPVRDQMLRHLDCAWELHRAGGPAPVGVFIVEGTPANGAVPDKWRRDLNESRLPPILTESLPHRSSEEREAIRDSFLGVTTWQRICDEFCIPINSLPEFCDD
ncbi:MAG: hypothetical protein HS101_19775 [Planctomycetia bacterium]|nr:hypothetical protein [Planctomycetia bacterium]MCC7315701.1 hypothetical protein [Planctomycetota bacterium]